jgi:hypothetical protein
VEVNIIRSSNGRLAQSVTLVMVAQLVSAKTLEERHQRFLAETVEGNL